MTLIKPANEQLECALEDFVGPDEDRAIAALTLLMKSAEGIIQSRIRSILPMKEDREDTLLEVKTRIWANRHQYDNQGFTAWLKFVKVAAIRSAINFRRKNKREQVVEEAPVDEVPDQDFGVIECFLGFAEERKDLYRLADRLWLGEPFEDKGRRILACKLVLLSGLPWSKVCNILNRSAAGRPVVSRQDLDEWIAEPVTRAYVAFSSLYLNGEALHRSLTHPSHERSWTEQEAFAISCRYRYAFLTDRIAQHPDCQLSKDALNDLFDTCRERFPFPSIACLLLRNTGPVENRTPVLSKSGLWRRLAFQYWVHDDLPHKDIYDRASPAAGAVGYHLTMGMLNVWLSNGRLFTQLADYVQSEKSNHER